MKNIYEYEIISKHPDVYVHTNSGEVCKAKILSCDFNKYVTLEFQDGSVEDYKWGYVYKTYQDAKENAEIDYENASWDEIMNLPEGVNPWKMLLSRKDYSTYKKYKRKQEQAAEYRVYFGDSKFGNFKTFKTLKKAALFFKYLWESGDPEILMTYNAGYILEFDMDGLSVYSSIDGKRRLKSRHIGKNENYKQWRK